MTSNSPRNDGQFIVSVWQDSGNQSHGRCYKVYSGVLGKVVFLDNPVCFGEYKGEFVAIKNEQVYTLRNNVFEIDKDISLNEVLRLSENQFEAKLDLYNKRAQRRDFIRAIDTLAGVECLKFINNPPS